MILAQSITRPPLRLSTPEHAAAPVDICQAIGLGAEGAAGEVTSVARTPSARRKKPAELRAWQRMLSGRRLDLLDPSPLDIEIEDIAHGLARVARWNGQTIGDHAFSVAQHSFVVEEIAAHVSPGLAPRWRLAALLHDAPEYVIGDMISPFKAALGLDYRTFEERLETAIQLRFGLPARVPPEIKTLIKTADRACAFFEATQIAGFGHEESLELFGAPPPGYVLKIEPMAASVAQARYLERYHLLAEAAGYAPAAQAFNTE
jgi:uncharacterized protein